MRLLHAKERVLREFPSDSIPRYAILSHTWGEQEISLQDIKAGNAKELRGYEKVKMTCSFAWKRGFEYVWIDTCCIDKTSSAELSEALNSMYRWYQEAEVCYAYLADVSLSHVNTGTNATNREFQASKWFTRGWTLQELLTLERVIFLNKDWYEIGTKSGLQSIISQITRIPGNFLLGEDLNYASIAQRMSWVSGRRTTRKEDLAYSLMGIFGIYIPMLYGEGGRAFLRLQEEIMKILDDYSIFAWKLTEDNISYTKEDKRAILQCTEKGKENK
ncbi:heterokaryon incompatibility protein-domain-containing protein [Tricladium varicosporioides]|nr:heterokaryon incompatibility protein-domain-containing protein [Hymenoscyphus varicosporioides]